MNQSSKTLFSVVGLIALMLGGVLMLPSSDLSHNDSYSGGSLPTLFINARLFDGEKIIENTQVLIENGLVIAVGSDLEHPEDAIQIDGKGKTLLPGLIDSHVHAYGAARGDAARLGVTTLLDMFRPPLDFSLTHQQRSGFQKTRQADLWSAGYLATASGGHGTQFGVPVPTLDSPEEAEGWVSERLAEGSDYIKLVIESGQAWNFEKPTLDAQTVQALVVAAKARNRLVMAHVSTHSGAELALNAGVDGLVHMFADRAVKDRWLRKAAASGLWVIPTTTVLAAAYGHSGEPWITGHPHLGSLLSMEQRESLKRAFPSPPERDLQWALVSSNLKAMLDAGIPILAGSDAPNPGTAQGASLHHELQLLVMAGMTPLEALRAATSVPAKVFELPGRGCLQAGCRADLLLVGGNPAQDITATADLLGAWKNGYPLMELADE